MYTLLQVGDGGRGGGQQKVVKVSEKLLIQYLIVGYSGCL